MSRMIRVAGGCLAAALALGACGDGGGTSGAQEEIAERADNICADAQDKVGNALGDDAAMDRDAIRAATDQLMAIRDIPNQDQNAWELFIQSHNNLWIALDDIAQALDPNVNDRARAERARDTVRLNHDRVKQYAGDYGAVVCAEGYEREERRRR